MISENSISNSADSRSSDCGGTEVGNGSSFRIRNVDEINSTVKKIDNNTEKGKRKLPIWLNSPTEEVEEKRSRSTQLSSTTNGLSDQNAEPSGSGNCNKTCENDSINTEQGISTNSDISTSMEINEVNDAEVKCDESSMADNAENAAASEQGIETNEACASDNKVDVKLVKIKVKCESSSEATSSSVSDPKVAPATNVVKQEATSSVRDSCKYGIRCYRVNPAHKIELAHPGDRDYRRPEYPTPPKGTPDCPYGDSCYRRNPIHFQHYSHPPSTDFKKNWQLRQARLRKQKQDPQFEYYNDSDEDEIEDEDDPFADNDSSDDYIPSDEE